MTQIPPPQRQVHTAPEPDMPNNVDAHMPPQAHDTATSSVYATPMWNPDTNEWAPSNEPESVWGLAEPAHTDEPRGVPVPTQYGADPTATIPDRRLNLIDSVRAHRGPTATPMIEHHHVVETIEQGAVSVSARTVRVVGNQTETTLLEENPFRRRALIKVVTTGSVVVIGPLRQGGNPGFTGIPAGPAALYYQATGDPILEVKAAAGVSAFGTSATGAVDVSIWEESEHRTPSPGSTSVN